LPGRAIGNYLTVSDLPSEGNIVVGLDDKVRNKTEELSGRAKEKAGELTDDERLEAEGRDEQTEARLKQAGEHVKDTARDVRDAFKR
jgi:uncharacterized protein YjbJ (UPF0337 family)